jgi:hypothetical protein
MCRTVLAFPELKSHNSFELKQQHERRVEKSEQKRAQTSKNERAFNYAGQNVSRRELMSRSLRI